MSWRDDYENTKSVWWYEKNLDELEAENKKLREIVMAVETKYPNETRHETALRYIKERENRPYGTAKNNDTLLADIKKIKEDNMPRGKNRGACGGTPRKDGSGGGKGNRGTSRQPKKKK